MIDEIMAILDKIEPLILVLVPALVGIWVKTSNKIKEKNESIRLASIKKAKDIYDKWEHEESKRVIVKIKELCNVYKDRSNANQVMYMQLENGTIATSKLCNMFLTCLAEDNRYSEIPKKIKKLQRVPYSQMAEWIEKATKENILIRKVKESEIIVDESFFSDVNSHLAKKVIDKDGYIIGVVIFNYLKEDYNGTTDVDKLEDEQFDLLKQFQASVESVFITYHLTREEKKRELGLIFNSEKEE